MIDTDRKELIAWLESRSKDTPMPGAKIMFKLALDAVREQPTNEPLTLEQLREMDGDPVYLVDMEPIEYGWEDGWYLVDADEGEAFNGVRKYELERCAGFAYRRPPERSENDA